MIQAKVSQGFDADIQTVNEDGIVVFHCWQNGMLLVMTFDDEMPAFTANSTESKSSIDTQGKDAVTTATGYVFHVAEPDVKGEFEFDDRRYAFIDIEYYVVWTDEEAVREKYEEVVARN